MLRPYRQGCKSARAFFFMSQDQLPPPAFSSNRAQPSDVLRAPRLHVRPRFDLFFPPARPRVVVSGIGKIRIVAKKNLRHSFQHGHAVRFFILHPCRSFCTAIFSAYCAWRCNAFRYYGGGTRENVALPPPAKAPRYSVRRRAYRHFESTSAARASSSRPSSTKKLALAEPCANPQARPVAMAVATR